MWYILTLKNAFDKIKHEASEYLGKLDSGYMTS